MVNRKSDALNFWVDTSNQKGCRLGCQNLLSIQNKHMRLKKKFEITTNDHHSASQGKPNIDTVQKDEMPIGSTVKINNKGSAHDEKEVKKEQITPSINEKSESKVVSEMYEICALKKNDGDVSGDDVKEKSDGSGMKEKLILIQKMKDCINDNRNLLMSSPKKRQSSPKKDAQSPSNALFSGANKEFSECKTPENKKTKSIQSAELSTPPTPRIVPNAEIIPLPLLSDDLPILNDFTIEELIEYYLPFSRIQVNLFSQTSKENREYYYHRWIDRNSAIELKLLSSRFSHKNKKVIAKLFTIFDVSQYYEHIPEKSQTSVAGTLNPLNILNDYEEFHVVYQWKHKNIEVYRYVGQSLHFWGRSHDHIRNTFLSPLQEGHLLTFALLVTNPEDWKLEVLEIVPKERLDVVESTYTLKLKTYFPFGLNMKLLWK